MSYQVLARKWRPRTFKELVGQIHVLQALVNALDSGRLHHAYLFTGTRGVGKTTIARILAKCLNCETGVTSEPCGHCSACQEIDEGRFIDLIEVDAASRTKVEDTRELLDNVQYAPSRGRFKIYLIDEVHMLSTHSFNALLKTLEEPPPHVKFLLATTDPQKLPITILSRCLQFSLKNMSPEKIVGHLQEVLDKETVSYEEGALWQLGRAADGSMRDALSLTDQAIAFCDQRITESGVSAMLGTIDRSQVLNVVSALATGDASQLLGTVTVLAEHGPDFASVLGDMLSVLHRVAIAQAVPDAVDNSQGDRDTVLALARQMAAEDIQLYYQSGLIGRRDLPLAPDPRSGFEMVLLRMLAFRPDGIPAVPVQPLQQGRAATGKDVDHTASSPQEQGEREEPEPVATATPTRSASSPVQVDPAPSAIGDTFNTQIAETAEQERVQPPVPVEPVAAPSALLSEMSQPEPMVTSTLPEVAVAEPVKNPDVAEPDVIQAVPVTEAQPSTTERLPLSALTPDSWISVFQALPIAGVTRTIASYCLLNTVDDNRLTMVLDQSHDTLYNDTHRLRVETALSDYFATGVALTVVPGEVDRETPAACRERRHQERQQEAVNSIYADERVQTLVSTFSGAILDQTIEPVD